VLVQIRDRLAAETTMRGGLRAPATVNRTFAYLSAVFSTAAKEWQWIESNPLRSIRQLSEPRGRTRFLSDDERAKLLAACRESALPELYLLVVLALSTGARRGEIEWLRWKDVDLGRATATLHDTKNGETRTLHLAGPALELLTARGKVRRIDSDLVFARADGQGPLASEKHWRLARTAADLKDFRFHDLRHSAASYLAMNGATLAEIAAVLGHKTLAMVKRYSHLSDQHTAGVVRRMNAKIFGSVS
jgi:integrase